MQDEKLKKIVFDIGRDLQRKLPGSYSGAGSERLADIFYRCFINTAETTAGLTDTDMPYVITGDIPAMWLRDSTAQVRHYIPYASQDETLSSFIRGLIKRQFMYVRIDPYTNAFNIEPNGNGYDKDDETDSTPWCWERKYEVDSLCNAVQLLTLYWNETKDRTIFDEDIHTGLRIITNLWVTEQRHENSPYYFRRKNCVPSDTLSFDGKGSPVAYTGMTWSGFRPSDDACQYGYLIPANLYAAHALGDIEKIAGEIYCDQELAEKSAQLRNDILEGINRYGIYEHSEFGRIYAYETDGLGHYNLMDDANVPSLLSIPYICGVYDKEIYENTRRFILSEHNPFYFSGKAASGIGSPHTPDRYIWHIALSMRGLTSGSVDERREMLALLLTTDSGTGYMHEGFDVDDPSRFTREWFAWSNSLFAEYVCDLMEKGEL